MPLQLVVNQTEQDIQDNELLRTPEKVYCKDCDHRWVSSLQQLLASPYCPNCLRDLDATSLGWQ